ncbi:MAG TPA: hypothetical protein VJA27_02075 [Patescibacteria group bacterium]|nr:hypothetical protein [Patescibacteria group bacterium]
MLISISEILDKSWNAYTSKFREFVPYMGLLFVPILLIGSLGLAIELIMAEGMAPGLSLLLIGVLAIVIGVFLMWSFMALTRVLREVAQGQPLSHYKQHLSGTKHLIWPLIYTSLLSGLIIFGGTLLLVVPGIIFGVWYSFANYAVTLDEKKGMEALRFSKQLVSGRWWAILFRLFVPAFLAGLAIGVLQAIVAWAIGVLVVQFAAPDSVVFMFVYQLVSAIFSVLLYPLSTLFIVYLYESAKANPVAAPASPAPTSPTMA